MPDYKADLQTNNTNLRTVLSTVQNLSSGSGSFTEAWAITTDDGATKEEQVSLAEVVPVDYQFKNDAGLATTYITSSNTTTFVRIGDTYETTLSSGTSSYYTDYDYVIVWFEYSDGNIDTHSFYPDEAKPWLVNISVPANHL